MSATPACPFCDAGDVERVAQWGGQMITAQWRCRACGSYFEALREEFEPLTSPDARGGTTAGCSSTRPPMSP
jgi:transposase-like protein